MKKKFVDVCYNFYSWKNLHCIRFIFAFELMYAYRQFYLNYISCENLHSYVNILLKHFTTKTADQQLLINRIPDVPSDDVHETTWHQYHIIPHKQYNNIDYKYILKFKIYRFIMIVISVTQRYRCHSYLNHWKYLRRNFF